MWTNIEIFGTDNYFCLTLGERTVWLSREEMRELHKKVGKALEK